MLAAVSSKTCKKKKKIAQISQFVWSQRLPDFPHEVVFCGEMGDVHFESMQKELILEWVLKMKESW